MTPSWNSARTTSPSRDDFHQARLHEPIHVRIERAEPGRQLRGKHVHRSLGEVDRRAALVGFGVERAALLDVVRHVRDVDAQPVVPVRQLLDRDRVVEIARVLAVDRDGLPRAEVGAPLDVALADRAAEPSRLRDRLVAVHVGDAVLADDDLRVDAGRVDGAQHFDDAAERRTRRASASA